MWECGWWRLYKTTTNVKLHIRENFPCRRSVTEHQPLEGINKGNFFGYVQCDIEVPENVRANFPNSPPIFKKTLVSKNDIGHLMLKKKFSTSENVDIKLLVTKWNTYSSAVLSSTVGPFLHENTPFSWVHSKEMLQQLCAVSSGRKKARWRKSKLKTSRRINEACNQQLLRLPDHAPEPTHCNEVPQWRKNTCSY